MVEVENGRDIKRRVFFPPQDVWSGEQEGENVAEPLTQTERRLNNLENAVDTLADMLATQEGSFSRDNYDTIESILQGRQSREAED